MASDSCDEIGRALRELKQMEKKRKERHAKLRYLEEIWPETSWERSARLARESILDRKAQILEALRFGSQVVPQSGPRLQGPGQVPPRRCVTLGIPAGSEDSLSSDETSDLLPAVPLPLNAAASTREPAVAIQVHSARRAPGVAHASRGHPGSAGNELGAGGGSCSSSSPSEHEVQPWRGIGLSGADELALSRYQADSVTRVSLLRAEDPERDVEPERRQERYVLCYVHAPGLIGRVAPCYEVSVGPFTTVGCVLDALGPHVKAAWQYSLPTAVSQLWLCMRCRPGGPLMPLCRRDHIRQAFTELEDLSDEGWPRLFIARTRDVEAD